jgi:PPOX class probable FMN-dependent enzyme
MSESEAGPIKTVDDLRLLYKEPRAAARLKALDQLDTFCRDFIALSPFFVLASCNANGHADASPRGDHPGFVRVLDERTLLIPDRPGNNRIDTMRNIVSNPDVGMIFFVPGFNETLRVNGTATIEQDPELCAQFAVNGKPALSVMSVSVCEAFFHCGKALMRSRLWDPTTYRERSAFPSHGRILAEQTKTVSVEESETYVAKSYRERLY